MADSSCSAIKEDGLPEGILFEIFLKVPWKSINRFKCVSKVWLSIISDPNFMKNKFKSLLIEPKPWVIFSNHVIPNQHHPSDIKIPSKLFHTQFMSSGNELSGYDGFSFNFLRKSYGSDSQHHNILHVLASSNGLVLCSVVNYSKENADYFVCNPITNESASLPPPPKKVVGKFLHGLVCETYSSSSKIASVSTFKVIRTRIELKNHSGFEAEIYFSELDEWRTYIVAYNQPRNGLESYDPKCNVVSHNGVAYWLEGCTSRLVAYDLNINNYECGSHHCNALDLPMEISDDYYNPSSDCLGVSEDYVCYGQIQKNTLRTWVLLEDDVSTGKYVWNSRYEIELPDFNSRKILIMAFSPLDRDVVILDCGKQIITFDMATRTNQKSLQRLCVPPSKNSFKIQHGYSPFILQPTLTTIRNGRR